MKFSPLNWNEVKTRVQIEIPKGRLRLQLSQAAPLYVSAWGVQALAGVSEFFDLTFEETVTIEIDADCRAFIYSAEKSSFEQSGEVFTNIDRMVNESGSVLEVRKAIREFQIAQRQAVSEIRAERMALKYSKAERLAPAAPPADPDPDGKVQPEPAE